MTNARLALSVITGVAALPVIAWMGVVAWAAVASGYPTRDRDWNHDGHTSVSEYFAAGDVGNRPRACGAERCTEYFSFKDGTLVNVVCRSGRECR